MTQDERGEWVAARTLGGSFFLRFSNSDEPRTGRLKDAVLVQPKRKRVSLTRTSRSKGSKAAFSMYEAQVNEIRAAAGVARYY